MKQRRQLILHWAILGLAVFALYLPTTRQYFYADDFTMLGWFRGQTDLWQAITTQYRLGYGFRPIADLILWLSFRAFEWNAQPYYLLGILQHWLASIFVYLLACKLTRRPTPAFLSGLIFAVAFSHQEVLTWIVATNISLVACGLIATILCYLEAVETGRWRWYAGAFAACAAAILTGQYAVIVVPSLVLVEFCLIHRSPGWVKRGVLRLAPFCLAMIPYLWIQVLFIHQGTSEAITAGESGFRLGLHVLPAFLRLGFLALPNPYVINYFPRLTALIHSGPPILSTALEVYRWAVMIGWAGVSLLLWMRGSRLVRFLLLWVYLSFAPYTLWTTASLWDASRYLYLPSIGFSILLALGFEHAAAWAARKFHPRPVISLVALALIWALLNATPIYLLEAQLQRSGEVRRDIIQQIQVLQPAFPAGAQVVLIIPHGIYADLQFGIPQFYPEEITVRTTSPADQPTRDQNGLYLFEYQEGALRQINLPQ